MLLFFHRFSIFDLTKLLSILAGNFWIQSLPFQICYNFLIFPSEIFTYLYTQKKKHFAQTHIEYSSLFAVSSFLKKEEKKSTLVFTSSCFNIVGIKLSWCERTLHLSWKDIFFKLFYLSFFLVICNFTIPFTNCCHGK